MPRQPLDSPLRLELPPPPGTIGNRLVTALVACIAERGLVDGDPLPSTRTLAGQLGVSRSVVVGAYEELVASGLCIARAGASTRIAAGACDAAARDGRRDSRPTSQLSPADSSRRAPDLVRFDLRAGFPDPQLIDGRAWNRAFKIAARRLAATDLTSGSGFGGTSLSGLLPEIRELLVEQLRVRRGVECDAADVFLFPSVAAALRVLTGALDLRGRTVAYEDPGYVPGRLALRHSGAVVRPVPVDDEGLVVDLVPGDAAAAFVTPAHQFPLGSRLSTTRRRELLQWAAERGGIVFEDDFGSEFWHDVPPGPALRAADGGADHVVFIGTTSKVLTRDVRLVWAVTPTRARVVVTRSLAVEGETLSPVAVLAFAEMMRSGDLTRHLLRSTRTYRARRSSLIEALRRTLPAAELRGTHAGLHLVIGWPGLDEARTERRLQGLGVSCRPIGSYLDIPDIPDLSATPSRMRGLVCSYSRLPESQAVIAARLLRQAISP